MMDPDFCSMCGAVPRPGEELSVEDGVAYCAACAAEMDAEPQPVTWEDEAICYGCGREDGHDGPCMPEDMDLEDPRDFNDARHDFKKENPREGVEEVVRINPEDVPGPVSTDPKHDPRKHAAMSMKMLRSTRRGPVSPKRAATLATVAAKSGAPSVAKRYDDKAKANEMDDVLEEDEAVTEGVSFDKFIDRILIDEGKVAAPKKQVLTDSPQRLRAARNQERPLGRIKFGGK